MSFEGTPDFANLNVDAGPGREVRLNVSGRLDASGTCGLWPEAAEAAKRHGAGPLEINASGVTYLDGSGAALLLMIRQTAEGMGGSAEVTGLGPEQARIFELFSGHAAAAAPEAPPRREGLVVQFGRAARMVASDMAAQVNFLGEASKALAKALRRPALVRWKDVWLTAEKVGADGLPIILLIGFLMGLIMSFQSAVTLKRFGAEIFVANMLGLILFRELGPLVTAILLAGRSGSSFAAEIGTMKVNEEVDALKTMGLEPVRFLAVPRLIATMSVTPLLSLFFCLLGLVGGAVVMLSMGYPLSTYCSRVFASVHYNDLFGGLFKAWFFSMLVAGIGCQRGLATKTGASSVGESTTSAVVAAIILIAVSDGFFAVVFFYLGF